MPTQVDSAIQEIQDALAVVSPQLEGLRDFSRLNLTQPESPSVVQSAIVDFERRDHLLIAALNALTALNADNYPDLPNREIEQNVFNDLKEQVTTIEAAFAKFTPLHATNLNLETSQPEFK